MADPDISRPRTTSADCVQCSQPPNEHQTTFEDLVTSPYDQLFSPITPDCFEQFKTVGNTSTEFTNLPGPYQTSHRFFPTSHAPYKNKTYPVQTIKFGLQVG